MKAHEPIVLDAGGYSILLEGYGEQIMRCVCYEGAAPERSTGIIRQGLAATPLRREGSRITSGGLALQIGTDGSFEWSTAGGDLLVREAGKRLRRRPRTVYDTGGEPPVIERVRTVDGERNFIRNLRPRQDGFNYDAALLFDWRGGEAIHGLGQGEDGVYDYRGHTQYLYQHNMRIPMPFFVSTAGYGVLVDCGGLMTFRDGHGESGLFCEGVDCLDYYVICGPALDKIIAGYRFLTGAAAMLPRWAFGFIQSKEAYRTGAELVETGTRYRRAGVPIDCVVQDWNTWPEGQWGQKTADPARYPDLAGSLRALHAQHIRAMVSVWPNMGAGTPDHKELREAGCLLMDYATYDAFSEKARKIFWEQMRRQLFSAGFDGWWCDSTEPFTAPDWNGRERRTEEERFRLVGQEHQKYLGEERANLYSLYHARGVWENQRAAAPDRRVVNLTRSGYAGSQRYGAVLWSGDICATWQTMRRQVAEGLNLAMSGIPYWTLDAGGFFVVNEAWEKRGCGCNRNPEPLWFWKGGYNDGCADPAYRELYVRWMELACFLPVFRSHGTDTPREIWHYGAPGEPFYEALAKTIRLRYRLMPYLYTLAAEAAFRDGTMLRSLLFDFADDARAAGRCDEFLLGRALLVCPVLEPMGGPADAAGARQVRRCYLPAGTDWYALDTGERLRGGREYDRAAPLDAVPVFVRAGAVLPTAEGLEYADQQPAQPVALRVYPGADGSWNLYRDSGDGWQAGSWIRLLWSDERRTLTLEPGEGSGPEERFRVLCERTERSVWYRGARVCLTL